MIGAHAKLKSAHDGLERHQDLLGDVVDDHLVDLHLLVVVALAGRVGTLNNCLLKKINGLIIQFLVLLRIAFSIEVEFFYFNFSAWRIK